MQVHITSVPLSFTVSEHDRLLFLHLLQPREEDIVVVVTFFVVVVQIVVLSPLGRMELGVCTYSVGRTNNVVVASAFVSPETAFCVVPGVLEPSSGSTPPRHKANSSIEMTGNRIILRSIV
jgi:hypothetical protein